MTIKGSTAWYRRNDARPLDPIVERDRLRNAARANGMFHERAERETFEGWFADSRKSRGAPFLAKCFERMPGGDYVQEPVQRHWWTWCNTVGGGRLLPKFDPIKIAADRLRAEAAGVCK